ncbi:MrcB family domain-containing protein [Actibacterium lipolyticum]|uniref:HNH endonuclease n=1 Tax=Actibacterium lipolyticum TaxID=1524263 RepID=A0A238KWV2_9RHOB|nr:DUF3578 domain-containing protein [Actibacterium lipolyticum]SMX46692.1 HNH endonuclease [Actibacterium lipolyticum]
MLSSMLSEISIQYIFERAKPFAGNKFGNFVRHDLPIEAKKQLIFWPFDLKVKSSVGAGNWASVPWLGFFDPLITETATKGFYVVYLINTQDQSYSLSMNQGATAVYEEFGQSRGRDVLKRRAQDIAERVQDFASGFDTSPIQLGSKESLPLGYEAGHAFGRTYQANKVSENELIADLKNMLSAYSALVDRGGTVPTDLMLAEAGSQDIDETRRYILSRRIERSNNVRRDVLATRKAICEGCGLNPKIDYKFTGREDNTPLDVHHSKPLRELAEGETRRYRIPDDFLVLCPNCHRMIHKQNDPSNLQELKNRIGFRYMRDVALGYSP